MFEDIEPDDLEFARGDSDREVLAKIHHRREVGDLAVDEGWALLYERYPDVPQFLLLAMVAELSAQHVHGAWSPAYFLGKLDALIARADARLGPLVGDLLALASRRLGKLSAPDAARLQQLHGKLSGRASDPTAARERLAQLAEKILGELDERTDGNRPIAAAKARPVPTDWKSAVASASGAKRPYAAAATFAVGDLVEHPKFGLGVVTATEPRRVVLLFADGSRKLVCG